MPTNDFKAFAAGGGANVLSQVDYALLTTLIANGFQSGTAQSNQLNKVWRQSTIMAAVLAQFVCDETGEDAVDDGSTATLLLNMKEGVASVLERVTSTVGGTANAITATFTNPPLAFKPGVPYMVRATTSNTTTTPTFTPNSGTLAAKTITKLNGSALVVGDIAGAGHWLELSYDATSDSFTLLNPAVTPHATLADTATNVAYSGLTGTVPTWNQNTTGNAATATTAANGGVTSVNGAAGAVTINTLSIGTAVVTTSGTTADITGIPSWVKRVTVSVNGVSTSGSNNLVLRCGAGAVATSGYVGSSGTIRSSTVSSGAGQTNSTSFSLIAEIAPSYTLFGTVVLTHIGGNVWVESGTIATNDGSRVGCSGGSVTLGGALDRIRLTTEGGTDTFDTGSINVLYE